MEVDGKTALVAPEVCFCFVCGSKLEPIGLGWLQCSKDDCGEVFLPFKDTEGRQNTMLINSFSKWATKA